MLDSNTFKKQVKEWIRLNPQGNEQDLIDFCEEMIPPAQFAASRWLIDQTVSWYKHVLAHREMGKKSYQDDTDDIA